MKILTGHISPETAYVVEDYPYGFRLRCKIRYWLEYKKGAGFRFMQQTTNPKSISEVWNKPKASTYAKFGACMFLDGERVSWVGLSEYCSGAEAAAWANTYGAGVPNSGREIFNKWVASKVAYDAARKPGDPLNVGVREATRAFLDTK